MPAYGIIGSMDESTTLTLNLPSPLLYAEAPELTPFSYTAADGEAGEQLFCFDLDPAQSGSIEPDPARLLGDMVFAAWQPGAGPSPAAVELPAGRYLFVQRRESLGREACVALAIEQQKDGLWERLKPGGRLYVRYLFEDGKPVTQLFRPCYW